MLYLIRFIIVVFNMYIKKELSEELNALQDRLGKINQEIKASRLEQEELSVKVGDLAERLYFDQLLLNEYEDFYSSLAPSLHLDDAENYLMFRSACDEMEKKTIECKRKRDSLTERITSLLLNESSLAANKMDIVERISQIKFDSLEERINHL